jgi:hypothetical protein
MLVYSKNQNFSAPSNSMKPSVFLTSVDFISYSFSYYDDGISALQAWLARTVQKLDSRLLGVCQTFSEENYLIVSIYLVIIFLYALQYVQDIVNW